MEFLAALMCGPLDRLRGHTSHILNLRILDKLSYAVVLSLALGYSPEASLFWFLVVAMMFGMSPGWGTPLGSALGRVPMNPRDLEWWQFGILERNAWLALSARGVIWGFPASMVALLYWDPLPLVYMPIFAVAMPLAALLGPRLPLDDDDWGRSEWLRGWIVGAMLLVANWFSGGFNI